MGQDTGFHRPYPHMEQEATWYQPGKGRCFRFLSFVDSLSVSIASIVVKLKLLGLLIYSYPFRLISRNPSETIFKSGKDRQLHFDWHLL
jgi:hypothetical protein